MTFFSERVNLSAEDFLLGQHKQFVDGLTHLGVSAAGSGQLCRRLDDSSQVFREHSVKEVTVQSGTQSGLAPTALIGTFTVHRTVFVQGFHSLEGDGVDLTNVVVIVIEADDTGIDDSAISQRNGLNITKGKHFVSHTGLSIHGDFSPRAISQSQLRNVRLNHGSETTRTDRLLSGSRLDDLLLEIDGLFHLLEFSIKLRNDRVHLKSPLQFQKYLI